MFPAERITAIFGNVEEIYEFARTFLADLQKHIVTDEPEMSQIGTCFLRHVRLPLCNYCSSSSSSSSGGGGGGGGSSGGGGGGGVGGK